jgi:short-subunit dehydrogenase
MAPHGIKVSTILPGYVKTNISKNALAAEAGKSFGKTDTNIEKGMEVDAFATEAVKAIFRGENEAQISKSLVVPLGIQLRNICPDLAFLALVFNSKNQSKAVKEAKSE